MKKVNFIPLRSKLPFLLLVFLLTFTTTTYSQDEPEKEAVAAPVETGGDIAAGESLFKANCDGCKRRRASIKRSS